MCFYEFYVKNALGLVWVPWSSKIFHETCAYIGISTCAYMQGNRVKIAIDLIAVAQIDVVENIC